MRLFLIMFFLLIVSGIGAGGYYGLVPGVSILFGSHKPRDLGVRYTAEHNDSYNQKAQATIETKIVDNELPLDELMEFNGIANLDVSMTQEEFTARANNVAWPHFPFEDSQLKINSDGTVEVSTLLKIEKVDEFLLAVGYDQETVSKAENALSKAGILSKRPPVYFKADVSVKDNRTSFDLVSAEIGRLEVPLEDYGANGAIMDLIDGIFPLIDNLDVKSADFKGGTFNFEGTVPTDLTVYTTTGDGFE
jgi:hypothetical protein